MTFGKIYTLAEVAEHLRMTNRGVAKIARAHGLCMIAGRVLTFTEEDVEGIKRAMRVAPVRLQTSRQVSTELVGTVSSVVRRIVLERSRRPFHRKMLKDEFGE